ncbi:alternative ribosome rescue aminoacyl-tRNA hydrolase ArfB [Maribacter sp. HTCC2170]|uniref:alternative ribosome rescue aminoacyl-tRNA hydrolase ArfB n=1 Tax=Maribacter sp. (strain HTCC2170 / KCCM 42371) TaxID=313603 RepID=UPI00006BD250|nr:alternative ribosome rescue aminoacyl-tRNA hydrolase ArfB [Maribacter sp. HTCC2170]EAR02879.1 Class I peptide chain release factor [Maribacter sp. HTCC2170]
MDKSTLLQELKFKAIRSSGAGGQHVNKVSSKIELTFDVLASNALSEIEKERISKKLITRLTKENILILQADDYRSQHRNKELAIKRFFELLENALKVKKKRKKSRPTKSSIEKRLKSKKKAALKKVSRRKPDID